jgi:hypothetical protein
LAAEAEVPGKTIYLPQVTSVSGVRLKNVTFRKRITFLQCTKQSKMDNPEKLAT